MNDGLDIYICAHRDFTIYPKNEAYKVITTKGVELPSVTLPVVEEDDPVWTPINHAYSECTRMHWIWKTHNYKKYIGFCHYRSYFDFFEDVPDVEEIFKEYDAIALTPYTNFDILGQYKYAHNLSDLELCLKIVKELYPDYSQDVDMFIANKKFYYKNMFIMKTSDFENYCEFIFSVMTEFDKRMGLTDMKSREDYFDKVQNVFIANKSKDYQTRIDSFLFERITNVFFIHNFKKIKTYNLREVQKAF